MQVFPHFCSQIFYKPSYDNSCVLCNILLNEMAITGLALYFLQTCQFNDIHSVSVFGTSFYDLQKTIG